MLLCVCKVPQYETELGHRSNCAFISAKMNRRNKKQKTISRRINLPLSFRTLFLFLASVGEVMCWWAKLWQFSWRGANKVRAAEVTVL